MGEVPSHAAAKVDKRWGLQERRWHIKRAGLAKQRDGRRKPGGCWMLDVGCWVLGLGHRRRATTGRPFIAQAPEVEGAGKKYYTQQEPG